MAETFTLTQADQGDAIISSCSRYRYSLMREWDASGQAVLFIGVNPSTADATTDDATVRKWRGFASRWGFGGFYVANLFAWRATDVRELARVEDPVGESNDHHLRIMLSEVTIVVPCWGDIEKIPGHRGKQMMRDRAGEVRELLRGCGLPVQTLGFTSKGDPKHPLMLGYSTELRDWTP